jgi:excisionase family DNA binding protein
MESGLVNVKAAAALVGCSDRHVWGLARSGRMPRPVRLGRAVRWRRAELLAWIQAGCPARERWEALRRKEGTTC